MPLLLCCGRYLGAASLTPPDPESLMRSRYTAYTVRDAAYLLATWHASTRPADLQLEAGVRWLGLEVHQHRLVDADHGEVWFVARYRVAGRGHRLQEHSRFVREAGQWWYVDGDVQ